MVPVRCGIFLMNKASMERKFDQDEGRVPLKPLSDKTKPLSLVKVLKKSREPCILESPETSILIRFFMLDHEGGMVVIASLERWSI